MESGLLLTLAVLACPVGMGLMMWMMMRGNNKDAGGGGEQGATSRADQEVAELRSEIEQLKAERTQRRSRAGEL